MDKNLLDAQIKTFDSIWKGGYFEGDPLDPVGPSKYRRIGYISVLHAVYQVCVKPYINNGTIALEIGPGRGAWTKAMLEAKEIWLLDAKSREDNKIDEYLGYPDNLQYFHMQDFSCDMLPDNYFTYSFSFGCLCHVPFEGTKQYARNLFPKLKSGANAFWMIADYDKRNEVSRNFALYDIVGRMLPPRIVNILEWLNRRQNNKLLGPPAEPAVDKSEDQGEGAAGRWYHSGASETTSMLREAGYEIVTSDVGISPRDVIVHFRKP